MQAVSADEQLMQHLDQVSEHLWNINLDDSAFEELKKKCSLLSAQLAVHHSLQRTVSHIAEHGQSLPIPYAQSRVCKFFDSLYGNDVDEKSPFESRWQELRNLDCRTFLIIAVSYTPLEITKMGRVEFDYLVQSAPKYSDMKLLPPDWIFRKEIQLALAEKSDLANLRTLKKRYHDLEFESEDSHPEKRARIGTHNVAPQNSGRRVPDRSSNEDREINPPLVHENAENRDHFPATISIQPDAYSSPERSKSTHQQNNTNRPESDSLTGDVYELAQDEVGYILQSGQIIGTIWLTDTYGANTISFVTIRISNELTDQLIIDRPRIM